MARHWQTGSGAHTQTHTQTSALWAHNAYVCANAVCMHAEPVRARCAPRTLRTAQAAHCARCAMQTLNTAHCARCALQMLHTAHDAHAAHCTRTHATHIAHAAHAAHNTAHATHTAHARTHARTQRTHARSACTQRASRTVHSAQPPHSAQSAQSAQRTASAQPAHACIAHSADSAQQTAHRMLVCPGLAGFAHVHSPLTHGRVLLAGDAHAHMLSLTVADRHRQTDSGTALEDRQRRTHPDKCALGAQRVRVRKRSMYARRAGTLRTAQAAHCKR